MKINRFKRLSQALVHFVMDRANLFTDHRISGLPTRAKYKHFRTIWEHTFDNFSHGFQFFFFEMMVVKAWSWYFVELLSRSVSQLTISFHTFLGMTFHIVGPRRDERIFEPGNFSLASFLKSGFKHGSVILNNIFAHFSVFEHIPGIHDQRMMLVLPNQLLCLVLSTSD